MELKSVYVRELYLIQQSNESSLIGELKGLLQTVNSAVLSIKKYKREQFWTFNSVACRRIILS